MKDSGEVVFTGAYGAGLTADEIRRTLAQAKAEHKPVTLYRRDLSILTAFADGTTLPALPAELQASLLAPLSNERERYVRASPELMASQRRSGLSMQDYLIQCAEMIDELAGPAAPARAFAPKGDRCNCEAEDHGHGCPCDGHAAAGKNKLLYVGEVCDACYAATPAVYRQAVAAVIDDLAKEDGGTPQHVPAWMLQVAWDHLVAHGQLTNKHLLNVLRVMRSSAVCAVLARLPGVQVDPGPGITLRYQGSKAP